MELRWSPAGDAGPRADESAAVSEVLALAMKLQAEREEALEDDRVIETGRELGIRPEYIREALALRREAQAGVAVRPESPLAALMEGPAVAVGQSLLIVFSLGLLPLAINAAGRSGFDWIPFFSFFAAAVSGWSARLPRLAGWAGALAVPVVLMVAAFYPHWPYGTGLDGSAVTLSLLSLGPTCAVAGRASAKLRGWLDQLTALPPRTADGPGTGGGEAA